MIEPDNLRRPDGKPPSGAGPVAYALVNCDDATRVRYVSNDLAADVGKGVRVDGECWSVRDLTDAESAECVQAECVAVEAHQESCERCLGFWLLTLCGSATTITTSTDLSAYAGGSVRLVSGLCYGVAATADGTGAVEVEVEEGYEDCAGCLGCYHLVNCWEPTDTLTISNDLAAMLELTPAEVVAGGYAFEVAGGCYQVTGYDTTCGAALLWDDVEAVTPAVGQDPCEACGLFKLTECPGGDGTVIYAYRAVNEDGDTVHLSDYVGQVARLNDYKCYAVSVVTTLPGGATATAPVVLEAYASCATCVCYELTACGGVTTIVTYTDLSEYSLGDVLELAGEVQKCWKITDLAEDCGEIPAAVAVVAVHAAGSGGDACDRCTGDARYVLTADCRHAGCDAGEAAAAAIVTDADLAAAVGKWIKRGGLCYSVAAGTGAEVVTVAAADLEYQGPYTSCEACLAAVITARLRTATGLDDDGNDLVVHQEDRLYEDGHLVAVCPVDDDTLAGILGGGAGTAGVSVAEALLHFKGTADVTTTIIDADTRPLNPMISYRVSESSAAALTTAPDAQSTQVIDGATGANWAWGYPSSSGHLTVNVFVDVDNKLKATFDSDGTSDELWLYVRVLVIGTTPATGYTDLGNGL